MSEGKSMKLTILNVHEADALIRSTLSVTKLNEVMFPEETSDGDKLARVCRTFPESLYSKETIALAFFTVLADWIKMKKVAPSSTESTTVIE